MNLKGKIVTIILCSVILGLYFLIGQSKENTGLIKRVYNVYLDGDIIGVIDDKEALYNLIDEKQQGIKEKYHVDTVYPPSSLQVIEDYSYNPEIASLDSVYNKIEELQDFTIYGYEVKVTSSDNDKEFYLYLLDKDILNEAIEDFILAFVDEEGYNDYLEGNQKELDDIGIIYTDMEILEDITIRDKYISINDKIYENSETLAQELLFGFNYKEQSYVIKAGDTIESVSEANTLNTQEFLIANPKYSSKDSLLAIGDTVNITLINPELSFAYNVEEIKEEEEPYSNEITRDNSKPSSYSEIKQPGISGIALMRNRYRVLNGEQSSEIDISLFKRIRDKVDQITIKGREETVWGWENIQDTGDGWKWPTQNPFAVTSEFAPRWGKKHNGIDISGSGFGSRIMAANSGTVVSVIRSCEDVGYYGSSCGGGYGNSVVIYHGNNIYTIYAHMMKNIPVNVGDYVSRGQVIGYMGSSGSSTGTHLHFGLSIGNPNSGGTFRNPRELY